MKKTTNALLLIALVVLVCSGCSWSRSLAIMTGGAVYDITCPTLNPLTGNVATLPNGKAAMSRYRIASGRSPEGIGVNAPGCLEFDADALKQGEDRSAAVIDPINGVIDAVESRIPGG